VKQLIGRVVRTIAGWGRAQGYFASEADAQAFEDELVYLLLHQKASFNSRRLVPTAASRRSPSARPASSTR